ncbi:hypothetical protein SKAU_G00071150 [Synaphobranchus kaupii]|uniref:Serpin domain-containing protein n=1 Tax=Synaphobranchus kaupii TaxID=118154 RepID=A0A9Q1G8D1_SYNKA|nr:hypothetical protein SKAU_G00071150 [Synaphobranchus kaupii]
MFYSPISISSALAMVYMGARGNTASQMSESRHLNKAAKDVHAVFSKLMSELNREGAPYALSLANRLYGEQSFNFEKNESKPAQMMYQTDTFGLATIPEVNCQILEMPYKGKELSMVILLPQEIEDDSTGLVRLEMELTYEKLIEWTQPDVMKSIEIDLALPKFKMEETYSLKDILVSLGMKDAFDVSRSDFSGMSPSNGLVVFKVVHKSFVEVNEEGTEAAAATGFLMELLSLKFPRPTPFIADHPFLFIRHNPTLWASLLPLKS